MKSLLKKIAICSAGLLLFAGTAVSAASGMDRTTALLPDSITPEQTFSKQDFLEDLQSELSSKGIQAAIDLYRDIPEEFADDTDLLVIKASLLVSTGSYNDAKKICTSLLSKDDKDTEVLSLAATIAKAQRNTSEWNKYIKALIAIDPYNTDANIALAQQQFSKKAYKQSRLYYQKALVRDANNMDALFGVGQTSYYLEDDNKAEATFKKILEIDPDYAPAYSYLGKLAAAHEEYKTASNYALEAVVRDDKNYDYIMDYGMYERNMGHYTNAEQAWTTAISLEPDYFLAYAYRAGLYDEQDMFSDALNDYMMVIKTNPDYYYAYESIGILALHEQQWKKAREAFTKCYEQNSKNISYPLMITYCYYMEGDKLNAKKFSDSVLRKLDRSTIDYAMLRVYHDLAGEMPLAQKISALQNTNQKGKMYFYLGLLYDMIGGKEASNKYFMEVVKLNSPMFFEYRIAEWSVGVTK
ncbi:MAG TPA: hypothetical protein DEO40_05320 [Treponema sp.]|nr:hypothetical protein [Treponema sp.]HBB42894.1 hypothetical protein [Treponema sp.]HCA20077.1 hypothetical protein [Treponema sp.]